MEILGLPSVLNTTLWYMTRKDSRALCLKCISWDWAVFQGQASATSFTNMRGSRQSVSCPRIALTILNQKRASYPLVSLLLSLLPWLLLITIIAPALIIGLTISRSLSTAFTHHVQSVFPPSILVTTQKSVGSLNCNCKTMGSLGNRQ